MKREWLLISVILVCLAHATCSVPCQWADYLGNPQRTAYSECAGPDYPAILWKLNIPGDFDTSPLVVDGMVLVLWKDSRFHLSETKVMFIDLLTGGIVQELYPENLIYRVFVNEDRIFGLSDKEIFEIETHQGLITPGTSLPEKTFVNTNMYPLVLGDRIIIPTTPVVCISGSDFHTEWNLEDTISDSGLEPIGLAGDDALIGFIMEKGGTRKIYAVDPKTGLLAWRSTPLPAVRWVTFGENAVYCAGEYVWAFDRNGTELWRFVPEQTVAANIVLEQDALYVADAANKLYKVGLDGNLIWEIEAKVSPQYRETHLVGAGDILYRVGNFGDSGSQITAYNLRDRSKMWEFTFETPEWLKGSPTALIKGSPAVAEGILIIEEMGGEIIALASDPDLFVNQGDAYLSGDFKDKAIDSYRKAQELYEKKGNLDQSQEIERRIHEIENHQETPPETTSPESEKPPESTPPTPPESEKPPESTPPTPSESTHPSESTSTSILVLGFLFSIGVFIVYFFIRKKH